MQTPHRGFELKYYTINLSTILKITSLKKAKKSGGVEKREVLWYIEFFFALFYFMNKSVTLWAILLSRGWQ